MSEFAIRRALDSDVESLAVCMHAAYTPYVERIPAATLPPLNIDYATEIRDHLVWVEESESRVAGAIVLSEEGGRFQVANIAVHPDFQGKGLGRILLDLADREARDRGHTEMHLATHALLEENLSLYQYLGWVEFERGENLVRMKRFLGPNSVSTEQADAANSSP